MRAWYFGTTALALAGFSASVHAEQPRLTVSGSVDLAYSVADNDVSGVGADGADGDGMGFGFDQTQIVFDWSARADNGLTYGARLDYRFQATNVDEQYIYLSGNWGRLVLGGDDGVVDWRVPGGESVLVGEGGWDGNNLSHSPAGAAEVSADITTHTDDAMKVIYNSPTYFGLSYGLAYIPNPNNSASTTGSGIVNQSTNGASTSDHPQYEGVLNYSRVLSGAEIGLGIGYAYQDGPQGFDDRTGMELGGTLSLGALSFGAGFGDSFDTGCGQTRGCDAYTFYSLGMAYAFRSAAVSIGYLSGEAALDGAGDDVEALSVDAEMPLAEGLLSYASASWVESTNGSASIENRTVQGLLGLRIGF